VGRWVDEGCQRLGVDLGSGALCYLNTMTSTYVMTSLGHPRRVVGRAQHAATGAGLGVKGGIVECEGGGML
jgi:hypothetical protein